MLSEASKKLSGRYAAAARVLRATALAAGFLCAVAGAVLVLGHRQGVATDPLNAPALLALMSRATAHPEDTNLVAQVRAMDLLARRAYFAGQAFADRGAWLMLAGALFFLAALKGVSWLRAPRPTPLTPIPEDAPLREARDARAATWVYGVVLAGAAAALALTFRPPPAAPAAAATDPGTDAPANPEPAAAAPFADDAAMARNWPAFRGFRGTSVVSFASLPLTWDGAAGTNILWKAVVPRPGFSSAVVWENRVFVTGADGEARELFCYDAAKGELLWRHVAEGIPGAPAALPKVSSDTGHAAATAATDGRRVFAIFSNGDLVACDLEGRRLWAKNLGLPENPYGHASSLLTHRDLLFVQIDQSEGGKLYALRTATGEPAWTATRAVKASWASPIVIESGGKALVLAFASPALIAYDAADGTEVWKAEEFNAEIGCSPAAADGRVYAGNEYAKFSAVDAATGKELWMCEEGLSEVTSPLPVAGVVILGTSSGLVTARDAATGEKLWEQEFKEGFYSSPVAANGVAYLTDMKGVTHAFKAAREYAPLGEAKLGETCFATPAIAGGRMYVRGEKHLFCIGAAGGVAR